MNLITMLPFFYDNPITKPIQDALNIEATNFKLNREYVLNQMFVETATDGLKYWENMLGIPKNIFNTQTRRENIKAKMRSRGTTTTDIIKNICEAYSNGIVEIIVNHSDYSFVIDFVGSIGIPQAFEELDKTVNEIKPCHLAHTYKFNYVTHKQLRTYNHSQLSSYTHNQIRNGGIE